MLLAIATTLTATAHTQTLYTINGNGPASPFAIVSEQTGPPAGLCLWPNGPYLGGFLTNPPFPCPTVAGFALPPGNLGGDIAVARSQNLIYVTDGTNITLFTPNGSPQRSFTLASVLPGFGTITGLGYDDPGGVLWVCNATTAAGLVPPGPANCPGLLTLMVAPFALPAVGSPYTDIEWDPVVPALYACTVSGLIVSVSPTTGLPTGYGIQAPPLTCATGGLQGLAMDHSFFAGPGAMYVTDGAMIERITPIAGPPASTFYATSACFPATSPPVSGLAYSAHAIGFGTASPPGYPFLLGSGQSVSPNPNFSLSISGAPPGSFAFIFLSLGTSCPPFPILTMLVYIGAPALLVQGPVPASGTFFVPTPLPANLPIPASIFLQGFVFDGNTNIWQNTNGLEVSIARP
jgi:hypothetical protein